MTPTSTIDGSMEFTLRLIGVWPDYSYKFLHRVVWASMLTISQLFQYWYIFDHIDIDPLPDLMNALSLCVSNSLLFLKLNILWWNGRVIFDIFATMDEDWNECASACSKMRAMINKATLSHRFSKCTIGAYSACMILIVASNILAERSASSEQTVGERQLFVKMKLPFESGVSPLYEIIMITQFLVQSTWAFTAGMLIAFIVTLILHIAGQIDIMCQKLLEISVTEDHGAQIAALMALVNKHQRIIAFADSIENVSCYMTLMQFFSNTFVICFLGFLIVTSLDSTDVLIKTIPYYVVVLLEAFVLCFTGEYLISKSKCINQAAYKSLWYKLRPGETRILLLLILRSQKQLTMTIGKFMDLSLEGFTSILKASASYVSVLHAMY